MYPWHRADANNDDTAPANGSPSRGNGAARPGRVASARRGGVAAGAVQVALDRRDNGGDPGQPRDE
jgi:hypothetical protein